MQFPSLSGSRVRLPVRIALQGAVKRSAPRGVPTLRPSPFQLFLEPSKAGKQPFSGAGRRSSIATPEVHPVQQWTGRT